MGAERTCENDYSPPVTRPLVGRDGRDRRLDDEPLSVRDVNELGDRAWATSPVRRVKRVERKRGGYPAPHVF